MNPGNGIETRYVCILQSIAACFLFMNPGNGIETMKLVCLPINRKKFLIYESR